MGGSLVRSLLIVTESGLNIYEHHQEESELTSSQLVSGMYTAFFTFFESEMAKGSVRSIELSRTKIIIFTYLDLNCIIEYERYCEEYAISVLTDEIKSIVEEIITKQSLNPNRYIRAIEESDLGQIFAVDWQQRILQQHNIINLLDSIVIIRPEGDALTILHQPEQIPSAASDEWRHSDIHYHVDISVGTGDEYIIATTNEWKTRLLSHVRLVTEFLSIIQPVSILELPYYLPYYEEAQQQIDVQQLMVIYGWVLPDLVETLLFEGGVLLVGDDRSTLAIEHILDSLGINEVFSISPFITDTGDLAEYAEYSILRANQQLELDMPIVNLYTNQTNRLSSTKYIRNELGNVNPLEMIQQLQELFIKLEEIHHDIFNHVFQIDQSRTTSLIREYKQSVPGHIWELAIPFFAVKTPFLVDNLATALNRRRILNYQPLRVGDVQNLVDVNYRHEDVDSELSNWVARTVFSNLLPYLIIVGGVTLLIMILYQM